MTDRLNPPSLAKPTGYSHVAITQAGRQAHISGQVAFDAAGKLVGEGDLSAQAEQVYANLLAALAAAGTDLSHVFRMVTYVVGLTPETAAVVRRVRMKHMGEGPYPASTMVGTPALVLPGLLIEVEASATLD